MMNKMRKHIHKCLTTAGLAAVLFATSCQLGLGDAIDLAAPLLTVTSPEHNSSIGHTVSMTGKATDNVGVTEIIVEIEETSQKFKLIKEEDQWYEFKEGQWSSEGIAGSSTGTAKNFEWELDFAIIGATTGTNYSITATAYDEAKASGNTQKVELTVISDDEPPAVSITTPTVFTENIANEYKTKLKLMNSTDLPYLLNGTISIRGSQKEDVQLDTLELYLFEYDNSANFKNGANFLELNEILEKVENGTIIQRSYSKPSNSRVWETKMEVQGIEADDRSNHVFILYTKSTDKAGNSETKVQGFYLYNREADIPWIHASFGYNSYADISSTIYPGSSLNGQCYDDDGLKEIRIYIYEEDQSKPSVPSQIIYPEGKTYYPWEIFALNKSCNFTVEIECTDINGNNAQPIKKYLSVTDTNPAELEVYSLNKTGEKSTNLFDITDSFGNFTIQGTVSDEGKDKIKSLKLAYIATETNLDYYITSKNWESPKSGDIIFDLMIPPSEKGSYDESGSTDSKYTASFTRKLNLFSDLNIGLESGKNKLNTQNFVILTVDHGDQSTIEFLNYTGDLTPPELEITAMSVTTDSIKYYKLEETPITINPFEKDGLQYKDKFIFYGKWNDNSISIGINPDSYKNSIFLTWKGISQKQSIEFIKKSDLPEDLKIYFDDQDRIWKTKTAINAPKSNTATITAEFIDVAGIKKTANTCFNVNVNYPQLVRITSTNADGSYNTGTITIELDFNKDVILYTGDEKPTLTLNNGGTAHYSYEKNFKSSKHLFVYTIKDNQDISKLTVSKININHNAFTDGQLIFCQSTDQYFNITGVPQLELRNIAIDKTNPEISKLEFITKDGYYQTGSTIFAKLTFTENIKSISQEDLNKIYLNFNDGISFEATSCGANTIIFSHQIKDDEGNLLPETLTLSNSPFTTGGVLIKDIASNEYELKTISSTANKLSEGIIIDNTTPVAPTISAYYTKTDGTKVRISKNSIIYENQATIEISYTANSIEKMYSIDDGENWNDYTGAITLKKGTYNIKAKQKGPSGIFSEESSIIGIEINPGNLLASVSAVNSNGTYTTGDIIKVVLNFREEVEIKGTPTLTLSNISPAAGASSVTALYNGINSANHKQHIFTYTVEDGQNTPSNTYLNVSSLNNFVIEHKGILVNSSYYSILSGKNLNDNRNIKVITGKPSLVSTQNATLNDSETKLTLTFNRNIFKGSGSIKNNADDDSETPHEPTIVLSIDSGYIAPAVIDVTTYNKYKNASYTNAKGETYKLSNFYTADTNGSDEDGNPNLTIVYVLNYNYDTNNPDLIGVLKKAGANKITFKRSSSKVKVSESTVILSLEDSFKLPVKGATYSITIESQFVQDAQGNQNKKETSSIISTKIENPVIRVNKANRGTYSRSNKGELTIILPTTTTFKVDCQTPGVSSSATDKTKKLTVTVMQKTQTTSEKSSVSSPVTDNIAKEWSNLEPTNNTLGASDTTNGYIYKITAQVGNSTPVYEFAYRSVFTVKNVNTGNPFYNTYYVRGGDNPEGGNTDSTFPLSWNSGDFDKIIPMYYDNTNAIFISWELNKTAYLDIVNGDCPSDYLTMGPSKWTWGMQSFFASGPTNYPLRPGRSVAVDGNEDFYGTLSFWDKHSEYRSGNTVIKSKKPD